MTASLKGSISSLTGVVFGYPERHRAVLKPGAVDQPDAFLVDVMGDWELMDEAPVAPDTPSPGQGKYYTFFAVAKFHARLH